MARFRNPLLLFVATIACIACAATPPPPSGTLEMRLLPGQSPVAEVDGPYAAYSRIGHGVVLRVWPETMRDGAVDISVIVRNTELDTIRLNSADVTGSGETGPVEIAGETEVLARFDAEPFRPRGSQGDVMVRETFSGGSLYDGNVNDGAVKVQAPSSTYSTSRGREAEDDELRQDREAQRARLAEWYLDSIEIEPGETAAGGVSLTLPETSQTIILNVDIDSEGHEFALVFERDR
jgi:hypothetical protein